MGFRSGWDSRTASRVGESIARRSGGNAGCRLMLWRGLAEIDDEIDAPAEGYLRARHFAMMALWRRSCSSGETS